MEPMRLSCLRLYSRNRRDSLHLGQLQEAGLMMDLIVGFLLGAELELALCLWNSPFLSCFPFLNKRKEKATRGELIKVSKEDENISLSAALWRK